MKKIILALLCVSAVVLSSCQADDTPEPSTAQKLLGKWRLLKAVDEDYQPVNTLIATDEVLGGPGDSVVFKSNGELYSYSPTEGDDMTTYKIISDNTIEIEDELYEIKTLTATDLYLHMETTEPAINSRFVQRLYFAR